MELLPKCIFVRFYNPIHPPIVIMVSAVTPAYDATLN